MLLKQTPAYVFLLQLQNKNVLSDGVISRELQILHQVLRNFVKESEEKQMSSKINTQATYCSTMKLEPEGSQINRNLKRNTALSRLVFWSSENHRTSASRTK